MSGLVALLLAAWPQTAAEKKGEAYVYDARVVDSAPCTGKQPIELRLAARGKELRLTIKNCGGKPFKVLHDAGLQPSRLELSPPARSVDDHRAVQKYDATVYVASFTTFAPGEERVMEDAQRRDDGSLVWGPFLYSGLTKGKLKVKVRWEARAAEGFDADEKKTRPVEGAVTGTFASNEVTL